MPYISQDFRKPLDPLIDQLAQQIAANSADSNDQDTAYAGLLNYTCTRLALKVIRLRFGKMRYGIIATVTGVFKNVSDEFYRRLAAPYEEGKIKEHGDVDLYQEFIDEMKEK